MRATVAAGTQGRPARPTDDRRQEAGVPRGLTRLYADWRGYLLGQQAYCEVHVDKSVQSAELWVAWAKVHGWNSKSGMRWAQSLIKKHARKTAQNKVSQARQFCAYCELVGDAKDNPLKAVCIANGRRDRSRHWAPFSAAEVTRLIEAAEARESRQDGRHKHRGPLCSTVYALLTLTGFRAREARLQAWSDVNWERSSIVVTADKAGRQDEIPLCTEAVAVLKAWRKWSPGERVFPSFPSKNTLVEDMKAAKVPGIDAGKKGEWHRFRKCAIRERAGAGADLRNLHHFARHDDIGTTVKVYDQAHVEELRAVAGLMPTLNGFIRREKANSRGDVSPATAKTCATSAKISPIGGLDLRRDAGPNVAVQDSPRGATNAPPEFHEIGIRSAQRGPEHLDLSGSRMLISRDSDPAINGAVGNLTPGSIDRGTTDRVLRILEALLGIEAAAESAGHDGRLSSLVSLLAPRST